MRSGVSSLEIMHMLEMGVSDLTSLERYSLDAAPVQVSTARVQAVGAGFPPVSYTHLTLPTICSV
eukprot:1426645-Prymnesium_polylepis.2